MLKFTRALNIFPLITIIFLFSSVSLAATISGGSNLLTQADADQIEAMIGIGPLGLVNIFTRIQGDGQTAADYHASCDGQGPTIVVLRATPTGSSSSQIVGGYSPTSWQSSGGYVVTPDPLDRTAMLFNLTSNVFLPQVEEHQIRNTTVGPTFGGGNDLILHTSALDYGYCHQYSYQLGSWPYNLLGGSVTTYFDSDLIEVFQIVPETVSVENSNWGNVKSLFR